jgi:nucleoside-diphosphate-sugar epimerase
MTTGSTDNPACRRVLVTGHHGYVGSVVAAYLAEHGFDVTGLDTFFFDGCDLYESGAPPWIARKDIRDVTAADLDGFQAVVHLAALSNDPLGELDPDVTFEINWTASVSLARAARDAGVERFVFAASCSMYGASGTEESLDETAPFAPLTAYAESKVRAEQEILALATDDFCPVSLRNATVYGPSPRLRLDIVVNNLVGWAVTTGKVRLLSDGSSWRPLIHVEDVARAVAGTLTAPADDLRGVAFNVGGDDGNYRVRELAEIVAGVVPGTTVEIAGGAVADTRSYRVDFTRFAALLPDHQPQYDVADGARQLYEAYREAGMTHDTFSGDTYVRLLRLRRLLDEGRLNPELRWVANGS